MSSLDGDTKDQENVSVVVDAILEADHFASEHEDAPAILGKCGRDANTTAPQ